MRGLLFRFRLLRLLEPYYLLTYIGLDELENERFRVRPLYGDKQKPSLDNFGVV